MAILQASPGRHDIGHELFAIDLFGMTRRRKWTGILVGFIALCAAIAGALLWPSTYRSISTILIEEPDVPDDLVKSTVSTFANDRLQVIQQRVMTNQNLSDIIDRFGLYPDLLADTPRSEIIKKMRDKIDMEVVSADLAAQQKPTPQQQQQASIAFTVSFDHSNPQVAQQVAGRLTDLYLAENVQSRQEKATGTAEFMNQQAQKLYAELQEIEKKLSDFRAQNAGALPEQLEANMQILGQMQQTLMQNKRDAAALADKKVFLQNQLSQISPYMPMTAQGQPATPQAQLMALELQYVDASAKYGPKHPDVVHLKTQIDTLKAQLGGGDTAAPAQARLSQLQSQLSDALQKYGEKHPEVVKLRKQIADLNSDLAKTPQQSIISAPKGPPDNPIYIQLQSQLGDVTSQLQGMGSQTAGLEANVDALQKQITETPAVGAQAASLQAQYDAAAKRYQDFRDKEVDAQVAQTMEQQSKGETFSVIQAPELPDVPVKPNRKLILAAGVMLAGLLGVTTMVLLELLDSRVYEPRGLMMAFGGDAPLASVPYISTRKERNKGRARIFLVLLVIAAIIGVALYLVDTLVMPLDVLFAAFLQRINP
jgi:uncharacterized protein involved in exopolysaccharide biosynthesis